MKKHIDCTLRRRGFNLIKIGGTHASNEYNKHSRLAGF